MAADPAPTVMGDALRAPARSLPAADVDLARELEEIAHRAWPPLREQVHAGWVLRESAGSSRRGNSVWARDDVPDLAVALRVVHAFYAAAGMPTTFQITPIARPVGLLDALDTAGFDDSGPTDVCVAPLAGLLAAHATQPAHATQGASATRRAHTAQGAHAAQAAGAGVRSAASGPDSRIHAGGITSVGSDVPDERWLAVAGEVLETFAAQRTGSLAVLRGTPLPQRYVTVLADGRPVGVGRGVLDGRWLGVYSMATLPAARGSGVAAETLTALATWADSQGADRVYLQVEEKSVAARSLYVRSGFRPVYRYSYRRRTGPVAGPVEPERAGGDGNARR